MSNFKILISPAKSMDFETISNLKSSSLPLFLNQSDKIMHVLQKKSPKNLMELMVISAVLADLNWTRNQEWIINHNLKNAKQAISAFTGDVYVGLDVNSLNNFEIDFLQEKLYILSGLYGLLKPLDLIQPYRLEMGTKLKVGSKSNLYQFWSKELIKHLNSELKVDDYLINLASNEYFKAVDKKNLITQNIITPEFKDYKNGELKMIGFFAKKARGMMVRFIAKNAIDNIKDLKRFNYEGYAFDVSLSTEAKYVFTR